MTEWENLLKENYPNPKDWGNYNISYNEFSKFVNLWLLEGIPYAFIDKPMAYETLRQKFLKILQITDSGYLNACGSAKIGYSLNPKKFAHPFTENVSDLDLYLISDCVYENLFSDIAKASADENSKIKYDDIYRTTRRGFIDLKYIDPLVRSYSTISSLYYALMNFEANVKEIFGSQKFEKITLRIYKNKQSALEQQAMSLNRTFKK